MTMLRVRWGCGVALWGCGVAQWLARWTIEVHSARSGPALDDSWDEYCIIKYVKNLQKNIKEKKKICA